ncbi:TIGR02678 family protein [Galactobacillus timonensis]|uniref:TIGR02678 family protein n=1 Tax=Galactobacillus timonensis TaxID=2041840 RepID=UPI000C854C9E|nr:TIGR02678 family protein [Galactobacillus timonensis]
MNSLQVLLENEWICKREDRDLYYAVRQDVPALQKFVAEYPGWRLVVNERLIRMEKVPAHAQPFMGIQEFTDIRDYEMFCVLLIFLEEQEEGDPFLLSDLTDRIQAQLKPWLNVDWTVFSNRRSLIRVMQYAEKISLVILHEGNLDSVSGNTRFEVLYENTGLSHYFALSYPYDTSSCQTAADFETLAADDVNLDRGRMRVNRVYRQLLLSPAMYWSSVDDADALYLRNQRRFVSGYLKEAVGARLDIHRNAAFLVFQEDASAFGREFPDMSTLSDVVVLVCAWLREQDLKVGADGTAQISPDDFQQAVQTVRKQYGGAWSKEYREMDLPLLISRILSCMQGWMMARREETTIRLYPAVWKFAGAYPEGARTQLTEAANTKKKRKESEQTTLF